MELFEIYEKNNIENHELRTVELTDRMTRTAEFLLCSGAQQAKVLKKQNT